MSGENSYRRILKTSSTIGGASAIGIASSLVRTKLAAVMLGPAGLGAIGLLQSLVSTASAISSLGIGASGTRQVAVAVGSQDIHLVGIARRALFWATVVLAVLGATVVWLFRGVLASEILGDRHYSATVGWLGIGVALTVAAGSQGALLTGLRRIADVARVSIVSAIASTAFGVAALLYGGDSSVVLFVLSAPLVSFLVGYWFVSRLPKPEVPNRSFSDLIGQWNVLARLGVSFMFAGMAVSVGQLVVRWMVNRELGPEALGQFQAAWAISMTYIGFVLQAMGADYYPRLGALIHDHCAANKLVNEQTEVALLLSGPIFVAMLGLAPWIVGALYSGQFSGSVSVLRWQVLGDVLKVASWPLGFVILAAGDGRTFMLSESLAILVLTGAVWVGLPLVGIDATGIAFVAMYACYAPAVYFLARRRTGFSWSKGTLWQFILLLSVTVFVFIVSTWSEKVGAIVGIAASATLGVYGLAKLSKFTDLPLVDRYAPDALRRIWARFDRKKK